MMDIESIVPDGSVGFWCHRFGPDGEIGRSYTEVAFTGDNPARSVRMIARRCHAFGGITDDSDEASGMADVIDKDGDIIGTFFLTGKGLRYFYKALDLRVTNDIGASHD